MSEVLPAPCTQAPKGNLPHPPRTCMRTWARVCAHMHSHAHAHSCPLPTLEAGSLSPWALLLSSPPRPGQPAQVPHASPLLLLLPLHWVSIPRAMEQTEVTYRVVRPPHFIDFIGEGGRHLSAREVTVITDVILGTGQALEGMYSRAGFVPLCRKVAIVARSAAPLGLLKEASTIPPCLVSASSPAPSGTSLGSRCEPATPLPLKLAEPPAAFISCLFQKLWIWKGLSRLAGPAHSF